MLLFFFFFGIYPKISLTFVAEHVLQSFVVVESRVRRWKAVRHVLFPLIYRYLVDPTERKTVGVPKREYGTYSRKYGNTSSLNQIVKT